MDLQIDQYDDDSSYDELQELLKGSTTYVSDDGETWTEEENALRGLDYVQETGQLEEVLRKNPEEYGLATVHDAKVTYSTESEEKEAYFRAVTD